MAHDPPPSRSDSGYRIIHAEQLGAATIPSPLHGQAECLQGGFVADDVCIRMQGEVCTDRPPQEEILFEKAGPREQIFFDPPKTRAAIVTCGGLCPGLNNVVRALYLELAMNYGIAEVLGIRFGFQGLNPAEGQPPVKLSIDLVEDIHKLGGTVLGSSRGPQDAGVMADFLTQRQINLLFCVGGDGTLRGAHALHRELHRRGLPIAVVCVPKTIDNDIEYCDRSFGLFTAIDRAAEVVDLAHVEAKGAPYGIGLVRVMGRYSGFIACGATLASQHANFTLIPENPFQLAGPRGFLAVLEERMRERRHAVIVAAEGAGQHLFPSDQVERDASGNPKLQDIGVFLKHQIERHFRERKFPISIKYIDPSYIVRSVPANADDSMLCDQLARRAAHAAMAGKTDVVIGNRRGMCIHVPIELATSRRKQVELDSDVWSSVLACTGQPAVWE
jgi:6-phosphofructokinase 1